MIGHHKSKYNDKIQCRLNDNSDSEHKIGFQFCLNSKIHNLVTELVSLKECVPGFTYPRKVLTRMKAKEVKFLWLFVAKKFVTLKGLRSALKCTQE